VVEGISGSNIAWRLQLFVIELDRCPGGLQASNPVEVHGTVGGLASFQPMQARGRRGWRIERQPMQRRGCDVEDLALQTEANTGVRKSHEA